MEADVSDELQAWADRHATMARALTDVYTRLAADWCAEFAAGLRPTVDWYRAMMANPRTRAMLATREDFERQYAKQRANKRRRDRRR